MDALSDVLRAVRLTGRVLLRRAGPRSRGAPRRRTAKSVVDAMFPGSDHLISYHLLIAGSCWATLEGEEPIKLSAGDIIVLPHGDTHVLATETGMRKLARVVDVSQAEGRSAAVEDLDGHGGRRDARTSCAASSAATRAPTTRC